MDCLNIGSWCLKSFNWNNQPEKTLLALFYFCLMVESYLPKAFSPWGVREGIMLFTCVHFWAGCTPDKLTSPSHYILMQEIFTGNVNRKLETLFQREQLNNKVGYLCIQPWQTYGQNVQTDVFLQPCVVKKKKDNNNEERYFTRRNRREFEGLFQKRSR